MHLPHKMDSLALYVYANIHAICLCYKPEIKFGCDASHSRHAHLSLWITPTKMVDGCCLKYTQYTEKHLSYVYQKQSLSPNWFRCVATLVHSSDAIPIRRSNQRDDSLYDASILIHIGNFRISQVYYYAVPLNNIEPIHQPVPS